MEIIRGNDLGKLKKEAGEALGTLLMANKKSEVLLLLAGGSAFELLDFVSKDALGVNVTIMMEDERLTTNPVINNYSQLKKTAFFQRARSKNAVFLDTSVLQDESLEEFTNRFENYLSDWLSSNPNGPIIATFGMGADGHTAGMLPMQDLNIFEKNAISVGYDSGSKNTFPIRCTITNAFIRKYVKHAILYVVGESKLPTKQKFLAETGDLSNTPARILRDIFDLKIFTDVL